MDDPCWRDAIADPLSFPRIAAPSDPGDANAPLFEPDDAARLTAVLDLDLLDTGAEPAFDRLVELATRLLHAPAGGIALVGGERTWFKAQFGIPVEALPLARAFCDRALEAGDVFAVEDAEAEPPIAGEAILRGELWFRSFAGIALAVDGGQRIGTLFVLDRKPRRLTPTQHGALRLLADAAEDAIRLRCSLRRLSEMSEERRRQIDFLNIRSRQLAQAQRIAQLGIFTHDYAIDSTYFSKLACKIVGLPAGQPIAFDSFLAAFDERDRERLRAIFRGESEDTPRFSLECGLTRPDGAARTVRIVGEVTMDRERPARLFGTLHDITEERAQRHALEHLAERDPLTGVYNRTMFDQKVRESLSAANRAGQPATLFLIDVDNLKDVNDSEGHPAGDELLRATASSLTGFARQTDIVIRVGGDEFALLAPGLGEPVDVAEMRTRLTRVLNRPVEIAGRTIPLSCSVGEAVYPRDVSQRLDLYQAADTALMEAKRRGKSQCVSYEPWLRARRERHRVLLAQAREGLAQDQFVPHFQPKIELGTRRVIGFEALARWEHPLAGVIGPFFFHELFEDREVGGAVSDTILKKAVETAVSLTARGVAFGHLAVNVNSAQLSRADFARGTTELVAAHGISPGQIRLEVVEDTLILEQPNVIANLRRLALAGFDISLDDFGTGYASLTHIRESYIREIKIDRRFVLRSATSQQDLHILVAIINLANSMNITVVAEGIETEASLRLLTDLGCSAGQGFLIGRPMPLTEVASFLARQARIDAMRPSPL